MDIESDEWKCLRHMLAEGTLRKFVRQLDVEYHVIINTPEALRQYYSIAKWLERQGFRIFHSRRNPYCPECWEMSYINSNLVNLPLNWHLFLQELVQWGFCLSVIVRRNPASGFITQRLSGRGGGVVAQILSQQCKVDLRKWISLINKTS